jgi:hypothetical protein
MWCSAHATSDDVLAMDVALCQPPIDWQAAEGLFGGSVTEI